MKKKVFSFVLVLITVLGLTAPAFADEENKSEKSQSWQDGAFNGGVYEGYYAQLNDIQKLLYDKIKEAFAEPVTEATIEFEEPILLKAEDGGSFTEDDKYQWMCDNMYNQCGGRYAVFRDHPELPWLLAVDYGARTLGEWIYDDEGVSIGYRMTGMFYENTYPWVPPEAYTNPSALEKGIDDAIAAIGETHPSRAATVRAILEYLCKLTTYESRTGTMPDKDGGEAHTVYYDHTSYSVLVAHTGVCNAYSAAFKLLCDRYGIPCVHLSGATEAGNHAWNYVQMEDGSWYAVDPTWSDGSTIDYSYFLVGKNSFGGSHEVPAENGGLACPPLNNTDYPYLEAKLGDVPEAIRSGESMQFSLSEIKDLTGTLISNVNVGLFVDNSKTASATALIQDGIVSLRYDTTESNPKTGSHSLYIKCTDGKQKGAILAAVEITLKSTEPVISKTEFTDVADNSPYATAIAWAVSQNITTGTSNTTFSPNQACNRAQILTFLWRASGSPKPTVANPFTDIKPSDYYYKAALWATENGLISGSVFGAQTDCTRAITMEYLWKAAGCPTMEKQTSFADVSDSADYAQAVAWAVENGITIGTSKTTFSPAATCTRGQIVTFLYRSMN